MERNGRFGGVWGQVLTGFVAVALLTGCVSAEELRKRVRESDGYYKQGLSSMDTNQQQAFVSFQKAIQLNPSNYDAHYALGTIQLQRGEYADAEREFKRCIELKPDDGDARNSYGRTLIKLKRLPEAVVALRKAVALPLYATPDVAYLNLHEALSLQGDYAGAILALQEALKINPPHIWPALVYLQLGEMYLKQGDSGRAREALVQAQSMDPKGTAGAEAAKLLEQLR